jgi:hypothetical protein
MAQEEVMRKLTYAACALALLAAGFLLAQSVPVSRTAMTTTTDGAIVSLQGGSARPVVNGDVAIRIEGTHDGRVVGTLVVKVDGKWVDVQLASANMRARTR